MTNGTVKARHAFQAFRDQLNAAQHATISVMDNDGFDDEEDVIDRF